MKDIRTIQMRWFVFTYVPRGVLLAFIEAMNHKCIQRNFLREFQVLHLVRKLFLSCDYERYSTQISRQYRATCRLEFTEYKLCYLKHLVTIVILFYSVMNEEILSSFPYELALTHIQRDKCIVVLSQNS